jgi:hypothetical protein
MELKNQSVISGKGSLGPLSPEELIERSIFSSFLSSLSIPFLFNTRMRSMK